MFSNSDTLAVDRVPVAVMGMNGDHGEDEDAWMAYSTHDGHEHSVVGADENLVLEEDHSVMYHIETGLAMEITESVEEGSFLNADFNATCRLAARLGAAAMNNGSIAENLERFLPRLMAVYGYYGFFSCSTFEISCNFENRGVQENESIVRTQNVSIEAGGFQLTKLGWLSDLAKELLDKTVSIQEANKRLDEIENTPDPWGPLAQAISFLAVGTALPALLKGTWWDVLLGPLAGAIGYSILLIFQTWPTRVNIWPNLIASFLCSTLGFAVHLFIPEVDPTIVTLSGVAILLPSSTVTLGINDLVSSHVISGFERLVKGLMMMTWLAIGYILGMSFVHAVAPDLFEQVARDKVMTDVEPINALWQLLFIPILCSSIAIVGFQMTGRDLLGAIVCMVIGYVASYFCFLLFNNQPYVPSLIGSLAITLYSNLWSRYYDRPNTIILFPAFQLVVAGIVGFMGLTDIVQGSVVEGGGHEQVFHMLVVAGIVVVGFLIGGTLVQPFTTI